MHVVKLDLRVCVTNSLEISMKILISGEAIKRVTSVEYDTFGKVIGVNDRQNMVQAARGLLSAVTRVLLLADVVIVKQIISVKKKVISTLNRLENVNSFSEFIKLFAVYGTQMVDLAHLTGDRQNVKKNYFKYKNLLKKL